MALSGRGSLRTPGPFGTVTTTAAALPGGPEKYQRGPTGYRWLYDNDGAPSSGATKAAAPVSPPMPGPAGRVSMARALDWPLYASGEPRLEDVVQGGLANCSAAALFAAMAHTTKGRAKIHTMIEEHVGATLTDLKDAADKIDTPPSGNRISSKRHFTIHLSKTVEVSDVFYTDDADENFNTAFLHPPQNGDRVLWACLLEKACAVLTGSYDNVDALNANDAWRLVLGTNPNVLEITAKTDTATLRKILAAAAEVPTVAASKSKLPDTAPVDQWHGYTVVGLHGSTVELYDPLGHTVKISLAQLQQNFQALLWM